MKLAETRYDNRETGCCARLDRAHWDGRRLNWLNKPFLKDRVWAVAHVPLNFGAVARREHEKVSRAGAYPEEPLWLSDEKSPWGSELLMAVDRDVPGAQLERLSGTFLTKVFEGPYRDAPKWVREMEEYARSEGEDVEKIYFFYATCPRCAKRLGQNQVVLFAKVKEEARAAA